MIKIELTPEEKRILLTLLNRVSIQGFEAPVLVQLLQKIQQSKDVPVEIK